VNEPIVWADVISRIGVVLAVIAIALSVALHKGPLLFNVSVVVKTGGNDDNDDGDDWKDEKPRTPDSDLALTE
jgi:hypothetical protein